MYIYKDSCTLLFDYYLLCVTTITIITTIIHILGLLPHRPLAFTMMANMRVYICIYMYYSSNNGNSSNT